MESSYNNNARVVKCLGALLATNASWKLVIEASEEQRWVLLVILNLFVMYVILVKEGQGSGGNSKEEYIVSNRKPIHSVGKREPLVSLFISF